MNYSFHFEIADNGGVCNEGTLDVEGQTEERAREMAEFMLEESYPGEDGYLLLSLEYVGKDDE